MKTLKSKLIIYFIIMSVLPAIIITSLGYTTSKNSFQNQVKSELTYIRDSKKLEVEEYMNKLKQDVEFLSDQFITYEMLSKININSLDVKVDKKQQYDLYFSHFMNDIEDGDIILIDSKGDIVYSYMNDNDLGKNIYNEGFRGSSISKAFEEIYINKKKSVICDFSYYNLSSDKAIASIASPILNGDNCEGVIVFKIGVQKINNIVSSNNNWDSLNIGQSGDIVIIGEDYKVRSDTRFLSSENSENLKTTVLLKEIKTKGVEEVLAGNTNIDVYIDHRNTKSIVAYTPLKIEDLNWGILVKIDESEAYKVIYNLRNTLSVVLMGIIAFVIFLGVVVAHNISNPIKKITNTAQKISNGDLTVEVQESSKFKEIEILTSTMKELAKVFRSQTKEIIGLVEIVSNVVNEMTMSISQVTSAASQTSSAVSETTATVEEVKQTVYLSSEKTKNVSESAKESLKISDYGNKATEDTVKAMKDINIQMNEIANSIIALSEQSENISELIESVDNISEQSNILAVNASIEAAKAGEHGKGFSIVAGEIRNLAEQSKQGTKQIRNILKDIQKATSTAVMTTEQGIKVVDKGMQQAQKSGEAINKLSENINVSAQSAIQIETSSQQQLIGMDQIAIAMEGINEASIQNVESMRQVEDELYKLQDMGNRLQKLFERYNL